METKRRGSDLAGYYEELLEEQEASGLSVMEFAEDVGISSATLYAWRRRLAQEETTPRPRVLEVHCAGGEGEPTDSRGMTLVVDERFRLELDRGFDATALERVLSVLSRC